jgi:hypothetical protein
MKNLFLINEDEKSRILGMHTKKGYKTINEDFDIEFDTLLTEKVQWKENNTEPYKFQDHGENIKSLQKALGFPTNLQTGNFWTKTEAAIKQKICIIYICMYACMYIYIYIYINIYIYIYIKKS